MMATLTSPLRGIYDAKAYVVLADAQPAKETGELLQCMRLEIGTSVQSVPPELSVQWACQPQSKRKC